MGHSASIDGAEFIEEASSELKAAGGAFDIPGAVGPAFFVELTPIRGRAAGKDCEKLVFERKHGEISLFKLKKTSTPR